MLSANSILRRVPAAGTTVVPIHSIYLVTPNKLSETVLVSTSNPVIDDDRMS